MLFDKTSMIRLMYVNRSIYGFHILQELVFTDKYVSIYK